jgi:predicted O-linked N-acetylglucosamine transferase (SPINDLY family)
MNATALPALLRQVAELTRPGRVDAALALLDDWLREHGASAEVQAARAQCALARNDRGTARQALAAALELRPSWTEVAVNLGRLRLAERAFSDALSAFDTGLAHAAHDHRLLDGRRRCLFGMERHREAVDAEAAWVAVAPASAEALIEHANNLVARHRYGEAAAAHARVAALDPDHLPSLWLSALLVEFVPDSMADLDAACARIDAVLSRFESLSDSDPRLRFHAEALALGASTFGLGILARDTTALLRRIGDQITRFTRLAIGDAPPLPERRPGRTRIGLVSPHWHDHTVGNLFRCWPLAVDRTRHEVHVFQLSDSADAKTTALAAAVDGFHDGRRDLRAWRDQIHVAALDLLVYIDIGLDPLMHALASQRLAPCQAVTWGHPQTTGLASIDVFFGADAMEPPDAASHYRERLVRLPGLGIALDADRLTAAPPPHASDDTGIRLFCPQAAFKLHPGHDALFARILAALPDAVLTLIPSPVEELRERLRDRLGRALLAAGVDPERQLRILPRLSGPDYQRELAASTVVLDSLDFSGGATTLDAIAAGRPIVTCRGTHMRGNQTAGMLQMIGLGDELVCADADECVARVIALACDAAAGENRSVQIAARKSHLLQETEFAAALNHAVREAVQTRR